MISVDEAATNPGDARRSAVRIPGAFGAVAPRPDRYTGDGDSHADGDLSGHGYSERHGDRHRYINAEPDAGSGHVNPGAADGHSHPSASHRNQNPNPYPYPDGDSRSDPTARRR